LHAIDALTGEGQWVFEAQGTISVAPAVADGVLYITSNEGVLYASN
jgi:outer membrane protein assembly factor BamB